MDYFKKLDGSSKRASRKPHLCKPCFPLILP
jgi:hypothetical protein